MFSFSLRRFHNLFIAPALLISAVSAHAQNPTITLTGHVFYSTGQPAAGATVTLTKNVYIVNPNEVSYDHTAADSGGSFTFQAEARCGVEYDVQATSSEIVDDEPLPPSGTNSISGCVLGNSDLGTLTIARPQQITLGGHVTDQTGVLVQGITVTMTRTKYDLTLMSLRRRRRLPMAAVIINLLPTPDVPWSRTLEHRSAVISFREAPQLAAAS